LLVLVLASGSSLLGAERPRDEEDSDTEPRRTPAYVPLVRTELPDPLREPTSVLGTPPPVDQWNAITASGPLATLPPDTHAAVGPGVGAAGRIVEVTNETVQVFDKTGASVAGPVALGALFPPMPGSFVFDPKVLFDQHSSRFFIVAMEVDFAGVGVCTSALVSSRIRLAVSTDATPDTIGAAAPDWIFPGPVPAMPAFPTAGGPVATWADYPAIGADDDSLFVTTNQFDETEPTSGCSTRTR
jgi:hypothetical protein